MLSKTDSKEHISDATEHGDNPSWLYEDAERAIEPELDLCASKVKYKMKFF